ncbi:MAG: hypothetical protein AKCLJLPJ_01212 [Fimbriimonadales bacterium]|nr:hypothetical protein [Fimbriimonadales bacterium]
MPVARYALVACTKAKNQGPAPAAAVYSASSLFRKAFAYCRIRGLTTFILSAKYGVLDPTDVIETYDLTLKRMGRADCRAWGERVTEELRKRIPIGSSIEIHCGREYIRDLDLTGFEAHNPLEGLTLGNRLRWYDQNTPSP